METEILSGNSSKKYTGSDCERKRQDTADAGNGYGKNGYCISDSVETLSREMEPF